MVDYGTNTNQQGDVLLYHGDKDAGEINESGGIIEMTQRYETMAYLALFGGNQEDDGSSATEKLQFWGNEGEPPERQYRGRFQVRLSGAPLTSASLKDLETDALYDLESAFLPDYALSVSVSASILSPKKVKLVIVIITETAEYLMTMEAEA